MARIDQTSIGGADGAFQTTDWTQLQGLRGNDLVKRYWKPVYCYLRMKGHDNEKAKDLTQGFFLEIVLGRDLVSQADRAKGKFRTLLLTALNRYVVSAYRAETARKRRPKQDLVSLDELDNVGGMPSPVEATSPDVAFHYAWASEILDRVLADLEKEFAREDKKLHWEVFQRRVLAPIMEGEPEPELADVCRDLGIEQRQQATNMVVTVKRRFAAALRRHVRQLVAGDADVDGEIQDLIEAFSHGTQERRPTDV